MAVGKNKRTPKGKKKLSKKVSNPFLKKEWYVLSAPGHFSKKEFGQTMVTRSSGKRLASDDLLGRVVEMNISDLGADESQSFRKVKLRIESVRDRQCLTNFFGMDMTRDRYSQLWRKNQTAMKVFTEVKTTDGYTLRIFAICFTRRTPGQVKRHCYCKSSQASKIRGLMRAIIANLAQNCTLKALVSMLLEGKFEAQMLSSCEKIYPIQNMFIRKVKVVNGPKFDDKRLDAMHEPVVVSALQGNATKVPDSVAMQQQAAADAAVEAEAQAQPVVAGDGAEAPTSW